MVRGTGAENSDDEVGSASHRRSFADRLRAWRIQHTFALGLSVLVFVFLLALAIPNAIVNVPAGHVGVLWERFLGGTVTDSHLTEGVHLIFPWDRAYIYDARLRTIVRTYDTISSNGLSMQVQIATRYRINRDSVGVLHKQIGPDYPDILLNPEIGANAREVIARYTPEQLYSDARSFIQAQILERMVTQLGSSLISQSPSGQLVYVEDTLIRSVGLPTSVVEAIERKTQQYHVMLEYDFRVQREELERQRKVIEARGIREFQEIVSGTITDEYLRLRGIDATLAIASSNNAKIIVIGGDDGLPLILNTGDVESGAPTQGSATLENISTPLAPNAAISEVLSTNAVQPDAHTLQTSSPASTQQAETASTAPQDTDSESGPTTTSTRGIEDIFSRTDTAAPTQQTGSSQQSMPTSADSVSDTPTTYSPSTNSLATNPPETNPPVTNR